MRTSRLDHSNGMATPVVRLIVLLCLAWSTTGCVGENGDARDRASDDAAFVPSVDVTREKGTVLQVRGVFTPDGSALRRTHPLRVMRNHKPATPFARDGRFRLVLEYEGGVRDTIPFDAYEEGDDEAGVTTFGGFTLEALLRADTRPTRVAIEDVRSDEVFAEWGSADLPP